MATTDNTTQPIGDKYNANDMFAINTTANVPAGMFLADGSETLHWDSNGGFKILNKIRRVYRAATGLRENSDGEYRQKLNQITDETEADLVGSKLIDSDLHMPVIDLDIPCYIVESVNSENSHLYIDQPMSWENYKKLLDVLREIGMIQEGWHKNAIEDEESYVRSESKIAHDRMHGKSSSCFPGCMDEYGNFKERDPADIW